MELRIAVVEDESIFVDAYKEMLEKWKDEDKAYTLSIFNMGATFLEAASRHQFDIVFLDISLPDKSGIEIANELRKSGYEGIIVIVTNHENYWSDAFTVEAYRYFIKPIEFEDFSFCLDKAVKHALGNYMRMTLPGQKLKIPYNKITHIVSQGHYVLIYTDCGVYQIRKSLKIILEETPGNFIKCHKAFVVNIDRVVKLEPNQLFVDTTSDTPIFVSQKYLSSMRKAFARQQR